MQSTRSNASATGTTSSTSVSGLKASPTWKPCARAPPPVDRGVHRLDVKGDAVRARGLKRGEVVCRIVDHQMAVDDAAL